MKLRIPIAVAITPVGLLVGALIVGRPVSVAGDLVLDPSVTSVPLTQVGPPASVPSTDVSTTDTSTTASTTASTTTSAPTSPATVAPTEVTAPGPVDVAARVVVLNATSSSGVAASNAAVLTDAGYLDVRTADASPTVQSIVYAREGFESTGRSIASTLGVAAPVGPFPLEPISSLDGEADVLVVIGADLVGAP